MQSRAVNNLARRGGTAWRTPHAAPLAMPRRPGALAQQQRGSFIKQVMEQVKRDMEKDPKLKKDWDKAQNTAQRLNQRQGRLEEQMSEWGDKLKSASSRTSELLSSWKEKAKDVKASTSATLGKAQEENESLKQAAERLQAAKESGAAGSRVVFAKTRETFEGVMDKSNAFFNMFTDEAKKAEKTKRWAEARASWEAQQAEEAKKAEETKAEMKAQGVDVDAEAAAAPKDQKPAEPTGEGALVVSEARSSTWDRFGSSLRDSPLLSSVFDNPLFDRMFGESEIAASIREMKDLDYSFRLEDFAEDIEYIVAPHIITTFLEGNQDSLKAHCGEAAFNAVNASIKARLSQRLSLDPQILSGPREVNLVSAKLNENGPPSFIWTFHMQQVNCLRDRNDEIIEGAIDDIRTVCYAMAVNKHPNLEEKGLEYPWQISELVILWNQPCF